MLHFTLKLRFCQTFRIKFSHTLSANVFLHFFCFALLYASICCYIVYFLMNARPHAISLTAAGRTQLPYHVNRRHNKLFNFYLGILLVFIVLRCLDPIFFDAFVRCHVCFHCFHIDLIIFEDVVEPLDQFRHMFWGSKGFWSAPRAAKMVSTRVICFNSNLYASHFQ